MTSDEVKKRTTLFQNWKPTQQETELPIDDKSLRAVEESLRAVFRDTGAEPPRVVSEPKTCSGRQPTSPASYCTETNTISLNVPELREIATPPSKASQSAGYGDFAAYAQVASRYALSVQKSAGYRLDDETAVLIVRPRGWHLPERHVLVDGSPISASLFDFGLYLFHCARRLLDAGTGPYFYLPKLESHREARLWNDVFVAAQEELGLERGTIKATVLIETVLAAFEMEEILFELREHSAGLNAGRWDYIFSIIKKFRDRPEFVLPDRAQVTMTVPFMRAYTELLVRTCHRRGAHAMGGMAAFVPSRKDPDVNETAIAMVREDKEREAGDGFDGTWVAHPDLVPTAMEEFDRKLGSKRNQLDRQRPEVRVSAPQLLDIHVPGGTITDAGLRANVNVGIQYIASWLRGTGAAAINNLMEDAATAEISRSQIWQWIRSPKGVLDDGRKVSVELFRKTLGEELARADVSSAILPQLIYNGPPRALEHLAADELKDAWLPQAASGGAATSPSPLVPGISFTRSSGGTLPLLSDSTASTRRMDSS